MPSVTVTPPRVLESPVSMECKVLKVESFGPNPGAGNLVFCEIKRMHFRKSVLGSDGLPDAVLLNLVARCGGSYYTRASKEALFEIPKPIVNLGIGVDAIPKDICTSSILTGKHLAMLGNVERLPDETEVNDYKLIELSEIFLDYADNGVVLDNVTHTVYPGSQSLIFNFLIPSGTDYQLGIDGPNSGLYRNNAGNGNSISYPFNIGDVDITSGSNFGHNCNFRIGTPSDLGKDWEGCIVIVEKGDVKPNMCPNSNKVDLKVNKKSIGLGIEFGGNESILDQLGITEEQVPVIAGSIGILILIIGGFVYYRRKNREYE